MSNANSEDHSETVLLLQHGDDGFFIPDERRLTEARLRFAAHLTKPVDLAADRPRRAVASHHDIFDDMVVPNSTLIDLKDMLA